MQIIKKIEFRHQFGANATALGQYDKAVAENQEEIRLDPNNVAAVGNLGQDYLASTV